MCLFQFCFPQGIRIGLGLLGHVVVLFKFLKESPSPIVAVPTYIPTNSVEGALPLHTLASIYCLHFLVITL